jgi:hypothetical protein
VKSIGRYEEPAREINVYDEYDVVVVGGGCAGFAAAVAAARNGARTLIIERFPFFGGTATASLMANVVGFRNQVEPDYLQTTKGIGEELMLALIAEGAAVKSRNAYASRQRSDTKGDLSYNYAFDTEKFKFATLKMVRDAGVDILFHTYFAAVVKDGASRLRGVIVENKSGRQAIWAKIVIDASGDGDVAFQAGVPYWHTKKDEAPRLLDCLMYKIGGFPADTKAPGCLHGDTMVVWGPNPGPANAADADELTEEEIRVRLAVYDDLAQKKAKHPDLGNAYVLDTGTLIGVRQTRFFEGEYALTGEDVLEGREFEDSIAMAANPIIHYYGYRRFLEHEGYQIPYRAIIPKTINNLYVVGRCMSSDQRAYESWRAMAHVFAIGEASGVAAALCAKTGSDTRGLDVRRLQGALVEQGCEIGQGKDARKKK